MRITNIFQPAQHPPCAYKFLNVFFVGVSFEAFISLAETKELQYSCFLTRPNIGAITLERTTQGV